MKVYFSFKVLALLGLLYASCGEKKESIRPSYTSFTEAVYASASIQPKESYQVYSTVSGIIEYKNITEGDLIKKGKSLFKIKNTTPQLNVENAKLSLKLAKENYQGRFNILNQLAKEIQGAELKLHDDSINYFRQKSLWEKEIGSKMEYDTRQLNYEVSINNLALLKDKYQQTKSQLTTSFQQAENNYKSSLVASKDFKIVSQMNGRVYTVFKEIGELVNPQEPLALIGSANDFIIELLIDEVDIVKVKVQQKVLLHLDAYQGSVFEASIRKIYPKMNARSQTFKVEAIFQDAPATLYPGLSGEANIVISEKKKVMTIPFNYLADQNSVITKDGKTSIKTGLKNTQQIEVLSGIDTSTLIYKP